MKTTKREIKIIELWESGTLARGSTNFTAYRLAKFHKTGEILLNTTAEMLRTHGHKE